jgi:hypothetical protein
MATTTETSRTTHLLALMTNGDNLFNARNWQELEDVHHPDMIAYMTGSADPIYGREAHSAAMQHSTSSLARRASGRVNRKSAACSLRSISRLRACWVVHGPSGADLVAELESAQPTLVRTQHLVALQTVILRCPRTHSGRASVLLGRSVYAVTTVGVHRCVARRASLSRRSARRRRPLVATA